ncbi:MFS transporter [Enterococcus sp. AZ109]|uniref:MFS transporter n=1 Tax=Enterococcus sp. AZ109 TaxID=2774634 RepID=UPI003F222E68
MRKGWITKIALLSISLVLTSAGAISGSIPSLAQQFPNEPLSSIELLTTIPALMVVIFVLLSDLVAKKIGAKQTVLVGLVIALVCGVVPAISENFTVILVSRAGLGIGFGLFNSLAVSLIGAFYDGNERASMIGFQSAFQGLGAAAMTFVAGHLSKQGWQPPFYIYLIILPIIALFALFVPMPPKVESQRNQKSAKPNLSVVLWALFLLAIMIIYMAVNVKISLLITSRQVGTEATASGILGIMSIGSMLTGFVFGSVFKRLQEQILPASLLIMGIGYLLITFADQLAIIAVASVLTGCSFSMFVPYLFNKIAIVAPKGSETLSTSLLLVGANLGSSFSPYGLKLISFFAPSSMAAIAAPFFTGGLILVCLAVVFFVANTAKQKKVVNS